MFKQIQSTLKRLHSDQDGDIPVGTILMIGAVVIPLVLMLVTYSDDISKWLADSSKDVLDEGGKKAGP